MVPGLSNFELLGKKEDFPKMKTRAASKQDRVQKPVQTVESSGVDAFPDARTSKFRNSMENIGLLHWTPHFWIELIDIVQQVEAYAHNSRRVLIQKAGKWNVVAEILLTRGFASQFPKYALRPRLLSRRFNNLSSDIKSKRRNRRYVGKIDNSVIGKMREYCQLRTSSGVLQRVDKCTRVLIDDITRQVASTIIQDYTSSANFHMKKSIGRAQNLSEAQSHEVQSDRPGKLTRRGKEEARVAGLEISNEEHLHTNNPKSFQPANEMVAIEVSDSDSYHTALESFNREETVHSDLFSRFEAMGKEFKYGLLGTCIKEIFRKEIKHELGITDERLEFLIKTTWSSESIIDNPTEGPIREWENSIRDAVRSATYDLTRKLIEVLTEEFFEEIPLNA